MKEVAGLAGVSRTTVSLVLSGSAPHIPATTQDRVHRAARELNFRPSVTAQQLRTSQSKMLALVTDEIASGPFAGGLIAGAQHQAMQAGCVLVMVNTGRPGDLDGDAVAALYDRQVDGIIFATVMTRDVDIPKIAADTNVVLLNCYEAKQRHFTILPDDRAGGRAAVNLALDRGHRRIAFIAGEQHTHPATQRLRGHREAFAARGVRFQTRLLRWSNWDIDGGRHAATDLMNQPTPPTAYICGNDRIALGVYQAASARGLHIPQDIAVIGYDDQQEITAHISPTLTTIRLPYAEMGARAVTALFDSQGPGTELVSCPLIERESTNAASHN